MSSSTVLTQNNFRLPTAPPSIYVPSSSGVNVPAGLRDWALTIDTTGLASGVELLDGAVEYLIKGVWVDDITFKGALTGPYAGGSHIWRLSSTIGSVDINNNLIGTYPTKVRMRIDKSSGLVVPNISLSIS